MWSRSWCRHYGPAMWWCSTISPCINSVMNTALIVVLQAKVRDQRFSLQVPQRVLQLHGLNEQVVFRTESGRRHRRLEIETEPLLDSYAAELVAALRQVQEQHQVEDNGRRQDRVPTEKIHLDLHRVSEPPEDIDVVPALFVVTARRVVINANLVIDLAVQRRVHLRLQDVLEHAQLGFFFRLERVRVVQYLPVTVPEDVGRVPPAQPEHARLEPRREDRLEQRLAALEILAA